VRSAKQMHLLRATEYYSEKNVGPVDGLNKTKLDLKMYVNRERRVLSSTVETNLRRRKQWFTNWGRWHPLGPRHPWRLESMFSGFSKGWKTSCFRGCAKWCSSVLLNNYCKATVARNFTRVVLAIVLRVSGPSKAKPEDKILKKLIY